MIGLELASQTHKGYVAVSADFQEFRSLVSLDLLWTAPIEHLQQYIIYLHRKWLSPGSIQGGMSASVFYTNVQGFQDHTSDFRIGEMIAGWSKENNWVPDTRMPISPAILDKNCLRWPSICRDSYEAVSYTHLTLPTKA